MNRLNDLLNDDKSEGFEIEGFLIAQLDISGSPFEGNTNNINDVSQFIAKRNESYFTEHGEMRPQAIIINDENVFIIPLKFDNQNMKKISYKITYMLASKVNAKAVCFISEAWLAQAPKGYKKGDDFEKGQMPSECDDKKEVLLTIVRWRDADTKMLVTEITRDSEGKVIRLYRNDNDYEGEVGGGMML